MMILAVYVIGNRTTHGHVARAWHDRQKPSLRQHGLCDVGEGCTRLTRQYATALIKRKQAITTKCVQQRAAIVHANIAIAATPVTS